jgi:integrase
MTYLSAPPLIQMVKGRARKPYPLKLPPHLERMALFMVNTGLRKSELCGLLWRWEVDVPELGASVFVLPEDWTKNGDERVVVLNSIALSVLEEQRGKNPEYVFTYRGKPIKRMLSSARRRARKEAGLPRVRVHDLRHTFGHRLRAAGVSFEDRQDLLGHRSERMTTHCSAPELAKLLEAANAACTRRQATVLRVVEAKRGQKGRQKSGAAQRAVTH